MSKARPFLVLFCAAMIAATASAQDDPDRITDPSVFANATRMSSHPQPHDLTNGQAHARFGIFGIDSIPNFNGQYFVDGYDWNGNPNRHWYTNTVGNPPQMGGTTVINAPLQPVNIVLLDAGGNLRFVNGHPLIAMATPFVPLVLNSPLFATASYSSSDAPTQLQDAIQRAQFYNRMKPDWHTVLEPSAAAPLYLGIRQSPSCPTGPFLQGCNYGFALHGDGSCCSDVLIDSSTAFPGIFQAAGYDINAGTITTHDISTLLLPNVSVFFGDLQHCCILGEHTFLFDPASDPERRWVVNFSSWFTPDSQLGNFFDCRDITVMSHEIAELTNDPFLASDAIHNVTPWWLAPNGVCQANLETGDVIERLPNSLHPMVMNGFTYHPQNEALQQWFEGMPSSDAFAAAYSYPDMTVLTHAAVPQNPNCAP